MNLTKKAKLLSTFMEQVGSVDLFFYSHKVGVLAVSLLTSPLVPNQTEKFQLVGAFVK